MISLKVILQKKDICFDFFLSDTVRVEPAIALVRFTVKINRMVGKDIWHFEMSSLAQRELLFRSVWSVKSKWMSSHVTHKTDSLSRSFFLRHFFFSLYHLCDNWSEHSMLNVKSFYNLIAVSVCIILFSFVDSVHSNRPKKRQKTFILNAFKFSNSLWIT